jgi:hypothetical protein
MYRIRESEDQGHFQKDRLLSDSALASICIPSRLRIMLITSLGAALIRMRHEMVTIIKGNYCIDPILKLAGFHSYG